MTPAGICTGEARKIVGMIMISLLMKTLPSKFFAFLSLFFILFFSLIRNNPNYLGNP
jgi:hypothetical protein